MNSNTQPKLLLQLADEIAAALASAEAEANGCDWAVDMLARVIIAGGGLVPVASDGKSYGTLYREHKFSFSCSREGLRVVWDDDDETQ